MLFLFHLERICQGHKVRQVGIHLLLTSCKNTFSEEILPIDDHAIVQPVRLLILAQIASERGPMFISIFFILCFISLHCALAAAQCIVIGPVCVWVSLWVYYHDNSKLRASIVTKLGL